MNAAGLTFTLTAIEGRLKMVWYDALVNEGKIDAGELALTRSNLTAILAILQHTPHDKIEGAVSRFDEQLTEHVDKFYAIEGSDTVAAFRHAQMLAGNITTLMAKSGLRS
jgi:hypothetical protein